MTDQNPIENNPQENQPDNTAQGINLTPESVQMPEDNTVPLNPALSIEPLSASAAPSEENVQNTAGGIVLESAFEASEQPSVTQDFTPQNDISSDGISVSAVPHTDIPVLNPFDGMTGENSQNTEMTGIAQPEESALATDNSATAASSAPDAFADLYNVSGTQPSDTQAPSISPESEENTLNDVQPQIQPETSAASADAFADLYSDASVSGSATATDNEQAAPVPEFQPAFEMSANTETDNTAAAEGTSFPETFTPDHGFSFDGQESSINETPAETMENTVAGIQPESEKSDNNTDVHEIPAIAPLTAETSQAEENNMEFLSAGIQETQTENTNQEPVLNEPQPEESVNSTENAVYAEEPVNESDNINADAIVTGISINMPEISSENAENITSDTVPENNNMAGETANTEPAADVSVNPVENTEEQNIAAETIPAQENAEPEPEPEVPAQETHESVPMPEQQEKEEKPAEPVAEVQPEIAAAATAVQTQNGQNIQSGSKAANYIVPTLAIMATAAFFFILGKKTAYMEKNQAAPAPQEITAPAELQGSNDTSTVNDTSGQEENNIGMTDSQGEENIDSTPVSSSSNDFGLWKKAGYSPEQKDALLFFYKEQERLLSSADNNKHSLIHYYVAGDKITEAEATLAIGLNSANHIEDNMSPLQKAAALNEYDMCRMLLAYGADINYHNDKYPTPLTLAVSFRRPETVKFLIDNGADQNIKFKGDDGIEYTAIDIARKGGFDEIIAIFEGSTEKTKNTENKENVTTGDTKADSPQK
ncbi:MAG: ankyrin repeat domain-containing protein [Elusimicrobiales bacterium]|nr:ankyrin repeat domain-containing protein [Elusimicrobiales bacterium]